MKNITIFVTPKTLGINNYKARIAQLVEHDLAKVGVAGSSLVSCSDKKVRLGRTFFFYGLGWWNW